MFFERPEAGRRAMVLHVEFKGPAPEESLDTVEECAELARTADIEVVDLIGARRAAPHPRLFVGEGKLEEIRSRLEQGEADRLGVIFEKISALVTHRETVGVPWEFSLLKN